MYSSHPLRFYSLGSHFFIPFFFRAPRKSFVLMTRHLLAFVLFCLFVSTHVSATMRNYCYFYGEISSVASTCSSRISQGSNCYSDRDISGNQYCNPLFERHPNCDVSYCCSIKASYDDALATQAHFGGKCTAETVPPPGP